MKNSSKNNALSQFISKGAHNMELVLLEQPQQEIISLNEVKNYARIDQDCDDSLIKTFISATREAMESILQKSIIKQKWLYQIDAKNINNLNVGEKNFPSILYGLIKIPLPKPPVISIEKVKVNYMDGRSKDIKYDEEIDSRFYVIINQREIGTRVKSIDVVYYAGISETSENVPYQLKLANLMLVANAYRNRFTYNSAEFMPKNIEKILSPFKPAMRLA